MKKHLLAPALYLVTIAAAFGQTSPDSLKTTSLDEFVVTGQYEAQSLKKSVYHVRVIDQEIIQARNATNVQTILSTEVGIRFTQDPTLGTSDISLMGMAGQNVKILVDGVPLFDRGATRESLNQIDVNSIERIEIVEGPMSVIYGTDALAGVINIITKKASENRTLLSVGARVLEESAGDNYEPFAGMGVHNESVNVGGHFGKWNTGIGVTRNMFGGWNTADLNNRWLPKDQYLGDVTFGYNNGNNFNAWYRLNYVFDNLKTPGAVNTNTNLRVDKEYISNRYTHQVQGDWKASDKLSFTGIVSHQDYSRRTRTTSFNVVTGDKRLVAPDGVNAGAQDKAVFSNDMIRLTSLYRASQKIALQSGFEFNTSTGFGDRIEGTQTISDYALFVSTEFEPVSGINIRPGLRFIYNTKFTAPPVIPSLNTKFVLNERMDIRLAYARGFRAPTLRELYFTFFDASHSLKGNTDLEAEFSHSFTGSFVWESVKTSSVNLKTTFAGFYNAFDNLIDFAFDPSDASGQIQQYTNYYKNKTVGGTVSNAFFWKALQVNLGGSYIGKYNIYAEEDNTLPQVVWTPEINTTLIYRFDRIGATANIFYKYTGVRGAYQQDPTITDRTAYQLIEVDAFHWADVTLTKQLGKLITLTGGVKNLFDVNRLGRNAVSTGGHDGGGSVTTAYGRSYFLGLNFQWNKK